MTELVLGGGYPEALQRTSELRRQAWHREYLAALLARDVRDISAIERMDRLPVLFELLARSAGRLVNWREFGGEVGLSGKTVERYVSVLEALFLVRRVRAWSGNEVQRMVSTPKLHFLDSGLLASTVGLSLAGLAVNRAPLGPVLESFVYSELLKALPFSATRPRIEHYRDKDQVEVDFVLEDARRRMVGIEVKASATVTNNDFRGLRKLSHHVGDRFRCGIVLHDGDRVLPFGPNLFAVPLSGLWSTT